ncbi:5-formyltetrahydrofolate cyclo-ligase [Polaribacter gochangensis]|uniref:5-formyltetrahydrofolate cyclo-ligase n=1 Tax=Polaribacter gochangensis TaxID=3252903 RepID=UPI003904955F
MEPILEEKDALRKEMYKKRARNRSKAKKEYDLWICAELEKLVKERNVKVVHAYLPMGTEIDIRPFIQSALVKGIKIISPKTLPKRQLENLELHALEAIEKGVFGTSHPANSSIYSGNYDLIIVPGLAFDHQNFRLGYGGGYYDTFLAQHPTTFKIGIFYPFQEVTSVPKENHDVCMDRILVKELV